MSQTPPPPRLAMLENGEFTIAYDPLWLQVDAETQQEATLLFLWLLRDATRDPHPEATDVERMREFVESSSASDLIIWAGGVLPSDPDQAIEQAGRAFETQNDSVTKTDELTVMNPYDDYMNPYYDFRLVRW